MFCPLLYLTVLFIYKQICVSGMNMVERYRELPLFTCIIDTI
nr:MAG TPA: hypothetical protein [Caudoviricetes sp.]